MRRLAVIAAFGMLLTACIPLPERNLALGTTRSQSREALAAMRADPKPLQRPVVVLNGYHGVPTISSRIARKLRTATSRDHADFLDISYMFGTDIDAMTQEVLLAVEDSWPCDDPDQTIEVDVVGISMGGLIARWAALPPAKRVRQGSDASSPFKWTTTKRLRIHRLFTLGAPHRGATLAEWIRLDSAAADMRAGSPFLATLDAHLPQRDYELICYAQLRDLICGATRCAPPAMDPIWSSGTLFFSHLDLADNSIFLADIARHLRDDQPQLTPTGPPPGD